KRELTRVVTPGTVTDDALLDPRESNYLAAICLASGRRQPPDEQPRRAAKDQGAHAPRSPDASRRSPKADDRVGIAWIDLSTGTFQAAVVPSARLADELARIQPAECLVAESAA